MGSDRRCLDWAGGYGVLTRLMRDRGIDFWHHDPFTPNNFAAGLEGSIGESWDLVTLFEVLEHLEDPVAELTPLVAATGVILCTTEILPEPTPKPGAWWYYAPETGQHITFYTVASLEALAERLGMRLVTNSRSLHALHRPGELSRATVAAIKHPSLSRRALPLLRRARYTEGLLQEDFEAARRRAADGT
jgi:hypothetical protein